MSQDFSQTNLAFFGTDLEKKIKEASANTEPAWHRVNINEDGLYLWRIENFNVVLVNPNKYGSFYEGDSYIILKITKNDSGCNYSIHFWLGTHTSIDEMGTAAYKTVELDNYFQGRAIQYREIQNNESSLFRSYFPQGIQYLTGGVDSGFRKVIPVDYNNYKPILFMINNKSVLQVPAIFDSLNDSDVFVLDAGLTIYIYHGNHASHSEKYLANCTAEKIQDHRVFSKIVIVDSITHDKFEQLASIDKANFSVANKLYRIIDDKTELLNQDLSQDILSSDDAYVYNTALTTYIWIGKQSNYTELMKAWDTAFKLTDQTSHITIIKDGYEPENFLLHFKTQ